MRQEVIPARPRKQVLPARGTLQLNDAEGTAIVVENGSLWLTMQDDVRDIVLMQGMRFEIDRSGKTLVTAERDSRFGLFFPSARPSGVLAWLASRVAALVGDEARRRRWVPHY